MTQPLTQHPGFTLVELLMTILIVTVLVAVAVPMYKHAVLKSQFTTVIPPTKSLAEAQEVFYLNNGEYAEDKEELDLPVPDTAQTTLTVSDKRNYKFVKGHHTDVPGANYIVYQKNSKRFADNVHCEAAKTDDNAKWLCEKGLGGTPLTGSISGADYLTYLLSGDAGTDKFLREDCPEAYYDNNGKCTIAPLGHYVVEGELVPCPVGTYHNRYGQNYCTECGAGGYTDAEGSVSCKICPEGTFSPEKGSTGCMKCPPGTISNNFRASCSKCGPGSYSDEEGATSCKSCPEGWYGNIGKTNGGYGSTGCIPCKAGTFLDGFKSGCDKCPPGKYSAQDGATSCESCPTGWVSDYGASSCTKCLAGTYVSPFLNRCDKCPSGTYSADAATSCTACPSGTTSNADRTACI